MFNKKFFIMKSLKIFMAILSVAVMFSCSKEQSSLDINSIPTKAIVMGKLCYDAGMDYVNNSYVQLIKPVANQKITVMVSNEDLSPDGTAEGYTIYETYSNESGDYKIEVPVTPKGTDVVVKPSTFTSKYSSFESVEELSSNIKFEEKEKEFSTTEDKLTLFPNDLEISDFNYTDLDREYIEKDKYIQTFRIYVGEPYYSSSQNVIVKDFKDVSGKNVIVTTSNGKSYGARTNSYGYAEFNIPANFKVGDMKISAFVEGYTVSSFKYVTKEYSYSSTSDKYIAGGTMEYSQYNDKTINLSFSGIKGVVTLAKVKMIFKPFYGVEDYGYSMSDWAYVEY